MGLLSSVVKGVGGLVGVVLKPLGDLIGSLFELPELPKAIAESGKQYNADFRINDAKIGDPKQVLYGATTVTLQEASQPFSTYNGEDETRHALLHVTVGEARIDAVRLGGTPVSSLSGSQVEALQPGDRNGLFHSNVFTSPDVKDIELRGGALSTVSFTGTFDFQTDEISSFGFNASLYGIPIGAEITVTGTASNDGTYTVLSRELAGSPPRYLGAGIQVDSTLVAEETSCTISYTQGVINAQTLKTDLLEFVFDNGLSQVTGPEDSLTEFRVGDLIGAYEGTTLNDNEDFTVIDTLGGSGLVLAGTVTDETATCRLYLKRRRVGPYAACPPGAQVEQIGVHLFFPQGLATIDGDSIEPRSVAFEIRTREIDDAGTPIGDWVSEQRSITASTTNTWRITEYIDIGPAARVQVDLNRVTQESDDNNLRDACTWGGLLGFIANREGDDPAVDTESTRVALQVRGSGQLSRLAENAANVDAQRLLPVYDGTTWSAPQATRNPAWALADYLTSMSRGRITYANLDLPGLLAFAETCEDNEDTFDALFDRVPQYLEGANAILRVGRAVLYRHPITGLLSIYRDAPTAPTLMLVDEFNCEMGGEQIETPSSDSVTGVQVQWFDPLLRDVRDGPVVGSDADPEVVTVMGLTRWQKSWEMATYEFRKGKLRVHSLSVDTEMEGLLVRLGDRVLLGSARKGYGQGGRVDAIDGLELTVWPPPFWVSGAQHYVYLQDRDGSPGARINCTRGATDADLVLATAVDVTPREADDLVPMAFLFGHDGTMTVPANGPLVGILTAGSPRALQTADGTSVLARGASLSITIENDMVHDDPGTAPTDVYALNGVVPVLAIEDLVATADEGEIAVVWDDIVVDDAMPVYEVAWRYEGALDWRVVQRGSTATAVFIVTEPGMVQVRVRGLLAERLIREAQTTVEVIVAGGPLTVVTSGGTAYGSGSGSTVTTSSASATVSGGVPPYTVEWEFVSGDDIEVVSPTSTTTTFRALGMAAGEIRDALWRPKATDDAATVAYGGNKAVQARRVGSTGGGVIP